MGCGYTLEERNHKRKRGLKLAIKHRHNHVISRLISLGISYNNLYKLHQLACQIGFFENAAILLEDQIMYYTGVCHANDQISYFEQVR